MAAADNHLAPVHNNNAWNYNNNNNVQSVVEGDFRGGGGGGGVKRKHSTMEEEDANKWTERQSILNMSMTKLQPTPSKVEASLRRSVLIFNTLRFLEAQLRHDCPQANLAIPATCLEPCHQDEVVHISKEEERLKQEKLEKQEVRLQPLESPTLPTAAAAAVPIITSPSAVVGYQYQNCVVEHLQDPPPPSTSFGPYQTTTDPYQTTTDPYQTTTDPYQTHQTSEQFLQDTSFILDSLLGSERVSTNSFPAAAAAAAVPYAVPYSAPTDAPMWEESDNVIWNSKYDEPFTNWLLNDDLDHIMQVLVSGSAS